MTPEHEWITPERLFVRAWYAASRERVWRAWTEPERLVRWFGTSGYTLEEVEIDLREGGAYRKLFCTDDGERVEVWGAYQEVAEHERLVFTWNTRRDAYEMRDTLVRLEFAEERGGTTLCVVHEGLRTDAVRESHQGGWAGNLDQLTGYLEAAE